jgi:hypothetical protein
MNDEGKYYVATTMERGLNWPRERQHQFVTAKAVNFEMAKSFADAQDIYAEVRPQGSATAEYNNGKDPGIA